MRAVWASRQEELLNDCLVSPHVFGVNQNGIKIIVTSCLRSA